MTRDRDIERVLDRFYAEGPSEMPDRLYLGVFDRIEHVPQRRLAHLTRFLTMKNFQFAAAAAVVVAVAAIGAIALNRPSPNGVLPTPAPTQTPAPSLSTVPAALAATWVGSTREIPGLSPAATQSRLKVTFSTLLVYAGPEQPVLSSTAAIAAPGTLQLTLSTDGVNCHAGDIGTYQYSLSPSSRALTLTANADACAARAAAIGGDWAKAACPNTNSLCLGDLDAGTHASTIFNPYVHVTDWVYAYGRLTYTVPDGWSNPIDGRHGYILVKQDAPKDAAIYLFATTMAASSANGCPTGVDTTVPHTASALAGWVATLPGLVTSSPAPVTVGGLQGMTLDVSVSPTWTATCPAITDKPYVPLFTNGESSEADSFDWGLTAGAAMRLFLLDLPDGRTMLIDIEAQDKATWDALVAEATPIVNTFVFHN